MSGPKISVYQLTGWARQVVMGQIRCEQQSVACAEQICMLIKECLSYRTTYEAILKRLELLQRRSGNGNNEAEEIETFLSHAVDSLNRISVDLQAHMPHISAKYQISDEAYEEKKQQLAYIKKLHKQVTQILSDLDKGVNQEQYSEEAVTQSINNSIAEDISNAYSFYIEPDDTAPRFDEQKKAVFDRLAALTAKNLSNELKQNLQNALQVIERINDVSHLSTFEAVTVKQLEKAAERCQREYQELMREFTEMISRYNALCKMAEVPAEVFFPEDYSQVQSEIDKLELIVYKQQEQSYIYDCVDEIMSEMGYDLIGKREVTKRNGKRFKNELYTFNEGTAVNITYSSDGQISMELGGIARQDRIPTAAETEVLTADMETFCDEFEEFEQRLREKGIIIGNRIALSPPSAEYAAIINVNDYSVDSGVQVSEIVAADKKKRTSVKKHMRRYD